MADDNFGAVMVPGPRPWWHIPAGIVGGVIIIGGGTVGYLQMMHHDPHPAAVAKKASVKKKTSATVATGPVTPPNYVTSTSPKTGHVFSAIAAINDKYIAWADQQISRAVPAIPSSGPYAGTLTPGILNSPLTLKKWPGPKVPSSLTVAGVKLPVGTPANGSIVGLTPSLVATSLHYTHKFWPKLTAGELMGAYQTAAQYVMAAAGNTPMSAMQYLDPYAGSGDASFIQQSANGSPAGPFTASGGVGMIPMRQVNYVNWISYAINPANYWGGGTILASSAPTTHPTGHVLIGGLVIQGIAVHAIGSGLFNGKEVIGQFVGHVAEVTLALLKDGGQTKWYVTGAHGFNGTNEPNATYWTQP